MKSRRRLGFAFLLAAVIAGAWILSSFRDARPDATGEAVGRRLVALIVIDTLRRDRVPACGFDVTPPTPNIDRLTGSGKTYCNMVTPGSWTLPTHASMFTGRLPSVHGANHIASEVDVTLAGAIEMSALDEDLPTLAEHFRDAGYQTALVSGNPLLNASVGVTRGFDIVHTASRFEMGDAARVAPVVRRMLDEEVSSDRPLFIVVNIILAHGPFEPVPAGVAWAPPQPQAIDLLSGGRDGLLSRFVRGDVSPAMRASFLTDLRRAYDWGVSLADRDLGEVMAALGEAGWLDDDPTLALTSDHGEMLGEEGLLDHGATLARPNVDVFATLVGSDFAPGERVDALTQSQDLFPTLLQSAGLEVPTLPNAHALQSPEEGRRAHLLNQPESMRAQLTDGISGAHRMAAVQLSTGRLRSVRAVASEVDATIWPAGRGEESALRFERVDDLSGPPVEASEGPEELAEAARALLESAREERSAVDMEPETIESLRALGYIE